MATIGNGTMFLSPLKRSSNFLACSYRLQVLCRVVRSRKLEARWQSTQSESEPEPSRWDTLSRVEVKRIRKKQVSGIWYIPSPSTTDPSSIITKLPQLNSNDRAVLRKVIFLASPGLAGWFSPDNSFHREAVNWMYSPILPKQPPESHVAIVDALPSPEHFLQWRVSRNRPYAPAEGLAVCLLSSVLYEDKPQNGGEAPAVLRFRSNNSSAQDRVGDQNVFTFLTLPLANTLFVNGLQNTAFRQRWHATEQEGQPLLVPREDPVALAKVQLNVQKKPHRFFRTEIPLYELTPERKVVSSMGNVVRELEGDDGQVIRASMELEAIVPKMLAEQQGLDYDGSPEQPQIQVYAKVMPPRVPTHIPSPAVENEETTETSKEEQSINTDPNIKIYDALWGGGKFYRVTSGGGGWGKKAGLLSLDQATDFEPTNLHESSMFPDPDADEDISSTKREPELGALVQSGHTIQFFAAKIRRPYPPYFTEQWRQFKGDAEVKVMPDQWSESGTQSVFVGVVAANEEPVSDRVKEAARSTKIDVLPGCFGVLSEGGVSISSEKRHSDSSLISEQNYSGFRYESLNKFRIDVPSATFKAKLRPFHLVQADKSALAAMRSASRTKTGKNPIGQISSDDIPTDVPINKVPFDLKANRGHGRSFRKTRV